MWILGRQVLIVAVLIWWEIQNQFPQHMRPNWNQVFDFTLVENGVLLFVGPPSSTNSCRDLMV